MEQEKARSSCLFTVMLLILLGAALFAGSFYVTLE
jgi:uncharacterized membrane protein YgdD (TMEM256/DUF423 family)